MYSQTGINNSLLLIMMLLFLLILLIFLMMPSAPSSLRTLPESMFKLPMMTSTIFSPLLQISRELFSILELLNGSVPSCFETREEGSVFGLMAVLGPELIVVGWALASLMRRERIDSTYREPGLEVAQEQIGLER
jgi:hypothetical protein